MFLFRILALQNPLKMAKIKRSSLGEEATLYKKGPKVSPGEGSEAKKETKSAEVKLQPEENMELADLKNTDPKAYRSEVWKKMGYAPKKYPAGSQGWKEQNEKFKVAADYTNQVFRAVTKERNGKTVTGYTKKFE